MTKVTKKQIKTIKSYEADVKHDTVKLPFFLQPKTKSIRRPQGK